MVDDTLTMLMELPPRARRIRKKEIMDVFSLGTTSACAENTFSWLVLYYVWGNYLRVRGEYRKETIMLEQFKELPPRARRIP